MWGYYRRRATQMDRLGWSFGGAVRKVREHFLKLRQADLDLLLQEYGRVNGESAERYARQTYRQWQSGGTKLSGKVMERLIVLVPPFLSPTDRYELLLDVLKKHSSRQRGTVQEDVSINSEAPDAGFAEAWAKLERIRHSDQLAYLPDDVMETARWLYDDDMTTARAMLARATHDENENAKASATREIKLLHKSVLAGQINSATYTAELPAGRLSIRVFTPPKPLLTQVRNSLLSFFR